MREYSYKDKSVIEFFSEWVMTLMQEIKLKVNSNGIIYEGENNWLKEKKLREVINEYIKKYQQELQTYKNNSLTP